MEAAANSGNSLDRLFELKLLSMSFLVGQASVGCGCKCQAHVHLHPVFTDRTRDMAFFPGSLYFKILLEKGIKLDMMSKTVTM